MKSSRISLNNLHTASAMGSRSGRKPSQLTGTYSSNPDGTNTVNLTFDVGATATVLVAVTDAGSGLQLIVTGGSLLKPGCVWRNRQASVCAVCVTYRILRLSAESVAGCE